MTTTHAPPQHVCAAFGVRAEELEPLDGPVWRFAVELPGSTVIEDYVRGTVTFDHAQIEDFVVALSG